MRSGESFILPKNEKFMERENPSEKKLTNVDFETSLEYTGFGRYNLYLILTCGCVLLGVNCDAYGIGLVIPAAECEFGLDNYSKGILTSASFVGFICSCCIFGLLSDLKGRKMIMVPSILLGWICSVLSAFMPGFWGFTILRFFNGVFMAAPTSIIYVYFGEFQSKVYKASGMAWISLFISFALIAQPLLAWAVLPFHHFHVFGIDVAAWKLFILVSCVPNLVAVLALAKLPESPKFLYETGRVARALSVLNKMYAVNTGQEFPIESIKEEPFCTRKKPDSLLRILYQQVFALFSSRYWKYTLTASVMQAAAFAVSSGLFLWYPDIVNQLANGHSLQLSVCEILAGNITAPAAQNCNNAKIDEQVFIQNLIIGVTYCVSYLAWASVVNFLGYKNFFAIFMGLSSACIILLNFVTQSVLIHVAFVVSLTLSGVCVGVIVALLTDVIPTHLCAITVCVNMTAGRIGTVISSAIVGIMLEWNCYITFSLYAASLIGSVVLVYIFPKHKS